MDDHEQAWRRRVETKLDNVSEAIVTLARMEERMITLFNRMDTYDKRQTQIDDRVSVVYDRLIDLEKASLKIKTIEKIMYIVGASAVSSLFWFIQR